MPKSFANAPRQRPPAPEKIEAYERNGAGHDNAEQEPRQRLSLDLPAPLHRRFKVACAAHGLRMTREIETFIKARCAELEKLR